MSDEQRFLDIIGRHGWRVWLANERLEVEWPPGSGDDGVLAILRDYKAEFVAHLKRTPSVGGPISEVSPDAGSASQAKPVRSKSTADGRSGWIVLNAGDSSTLFVGTNQSKPWKSPNGEQHARNPNSDEQTFHIFLRRQK